MKNWEITNGEVPLGFGMALAQNERALEAFSRMSPAQRQTVIAEAGTVGSHREMQELVAKLESR